MWTEGDFLGTMMTSTESIVGLPSGDVTRTRSIARLIPSQRWRKDAVLNITGVPAKPTEGLDDSILESLDNPQLMIDAEIKDILDDEGADPTGMPLCLQPGKKLPSLRITQQDLIKYEYTAECPRCIATQFGNLSNNPSHSDACRRRVYKAMYRADASKLSR